MDGRKSLSTSLHILLFLFQKRYLERFPIFRRSHCKENAEYYVLVLLPGFIPDPIQDDRNNY